MHPVTQELVQELDILFGLYQLVLEVTCTVTQGPKAEGAAVITCLDSRQRLMTRIKNATDKSVRLSRLFVTNNQILTNEKELVAEKKRMVQDAWNQVQKTEQVLMQRLTSHLQGMRSEMIDVNKKSRATEAYIQAPRTLAFVA